MVTWQREKPRTAGVLGDRDDFGEWVADVEEILDDRAQALLIYDGIDPEDYPDDAQADWWVDRAAAVAGVVLAVCVAVLVAVQAARALGWWS